MEKQPMQFIMHVQLFSKVKEVNRPINLYLNRVINREQTHNSKRENERAELFM